jgi:hypothetical protein
MIRNTKKGRTPFKSTRHGKTRRVQRGGALVKDSKGNKIGEYDDITKQGQAVYPGVGVYVGQFDENGLPCVHGTLTYEDGDVYEGEWLNNRAHGRGIMTYKDIGVYEGEWQNGQRTEGTITYYDGGVYKGEWANGKKNGQGTMTYANGAKYVGDWFDNQMHGQGIMTYANGSVYEGGWAKGGRSGIGTLTYTNGTNYVGGWFNDRMHGTGIYTFENGDVYNGELRESNFSGTGTMHYKVGGVYEGEWSNDDRHGHGRMTYADGKRKEGEWRNGDFILSVANRTRSQAPRYHPYEVGPSRVVPNMFTLQPTRIPEASITLSDGIMYNIQTAMALKKLIEVQIQEGQRPSTPYRVQLTDDDISRLDAFLELLKGGKKRRNRRVI